MSLMYKARSPETNRAYVKIPQPYQKYKNAVIHTQNCSSIMSPFTVPHSFLSK